MKYFVEDGVSITGRACKVYGPDSEVTAELLGHTDGKGMKTLLSKGKVYSADMSKPDEKAAKREAAAKEVAADEAAAAKKPAEKKAAAGAGGGAQKKPAAVPAATPAPAPGE